MRHCSIRPGILAPQRVVGSSSVSIRASSDFKPPPISRDAKSTSIVCRSRPTHYPCSFSRGLTCMRYACCTRPGIWLSYGRQSATHLHPLRRRVRLGSAEADGLGITVKLFSRIQSTLGNPKWDFPPTDIRSSRSLVALFRKVDFYTYCDDNNEKPMPRLTHMVTLASGGGSWASLGTCMHRFIVEQREPNQGVRMLQLLRFTPRGGPSQHPGWLMRMASRPMRRMRTLAVHHAWGARLAASTKPTVPRAIIVSDARQQSRAAKVGAKV